MCALSETLPDRLPGICAIIQGSPHFSLSFLPCSAPMMTLTQSAIHPVPPITRGSLINVCIVPVNSYNPQRLLHHWRRAEWLHEGTEGTNSRVYTHHIIHSWYVHSLRTNKLILMQVYAPLLPQSIMKRKKLKILRGFFHHSDPIFCPLLQQNPSLPPSLVETFNRVSTRTYVPSIYTL